MALCSHSLDLTGVAGDPASRLHRLDPRAKTVGLLGVTVVAVSTPLSAWPVYLVCAALLAIYAAAARVPLGVVWRRARVVAPVIVLVAIFIPFLRPGGEELALGPLTVHQRGLEVFATVLAKASIGIVAAILLGATTTYPAVLRGLEAMRMPRLLVLIASLMYRYLFVVAEEVARMRAALAARAFRPRHVFQAGPVGRVATALFLRTHNRGERVYLAMLSRGYAGRMPYLDPLRFTAADGLFVGVMALALLSARVGVPLVS